MVRTLSASGTFVQKYIFLATWLCLTGGLNVLIWSGRMSAAGGGPPSLGAKLTFLAFWILPPLFILWVMRFYKRVQMSDDGLLISDPREEIFVPFSAIASVSQPKIEPKAYVEVAFREPTAFGERIRFIPRPRFGFLPSLDPAVCEFLERMKRASAGTGSAG